MQKIILTLTANRAHHEFKLNPSTLDFVFSVYTPEQRTQFFTQQVYCESQGWLDPVVPIYTDSTPVEVLANAHANSKSCVFVDTNANSFTNVFTGADLPAVWEWFVIENKNFKPMIDYYAANPNHGTLSATIMYGSMPQRLDVAQIYG